MIILLTLLNFGFLATGVIYAWKFHSWLREAHDKADFIYQWMKNIDVMLMQIQVRNDELKGKWLELSIKVGEIERWKKDTE